MPDDPWTLAQNIRVAPAASEPAQRCGDDESPQYGDPVTKGGVTMPGEQVKPAGPDYLAAQRRVEASLRASPDPYAHAVADWLDVGAARSPAERIAAVVDDASTSGDPRIYAAAFGACRSQNPPPPSCGMLSPRRWATLDAGNAVPWLAVFAEATTNGDDAARQEALSHMAEAAHYRTGSFDMPALIGEQLPDEEASGAASLALSMQALGNAPGAADGVPALMDACRNKASGDVDRARQCDAIARLMFDHADTLLAHLVGGSLHFQATGDPSLRDQAHAEQRQISDRLAATASVTACGVVREVRQQFRRDAEIGELQALRERAASSATP